VKFLNAHDSFRFAKQSVLPCIFNFREHEVSEFVLWVLRHHHSFVGVGEATHLVRLAPELVQENEMVAANLFFLSENLL